MGSEYKDYGKKKGKSSGNKEVAVSSNDESWVVDNALRTLSDCEDIKSNPKLMADVKKLAKEKLAAAEAVAKKV